MIEPFGEPWTTMPLTPDEIRSREFNLADRGYDRAEVRAFLSEVAAQAAAGATRAPGSPWPEAEERLVLILEAAARTAEFLRAEAAGAIREIREATGRPGVETTKVAAEDPARVAEVAAVRDRLTAALHEVETALGAIEPAVQRTEPSTRPSS